MCAAPRRTPKRKPKRRITIAPGIYRDRQFLLGVVRIGSRVTGEQAIRERFPLDTEISDIQAWQHRTFADLLDTRPDLPCDGSLIADVSTFLSMIPQGPKRDEFGWLLQHWITSPLGTVDRHAITREQIISQRSRWLETGAAITTVNHRVRALRALYDGLDGPDLPHPTDKVKNLSPPPVEPRGIPKAYVDLILDAVRDQGRAARGEERPRLSQTKIRLTCIARTGIPHIQLERLTPRDVDLKGARIYLQPRRKGKGAAGVWVALLPEAVAAFQAFADARLWGQSFSRSSMGKSWKAAIRRVTSRLSADARRTKDATAFDAWVNAIPPGCRPYDLRHAFGTEAYRVTGDVRAVSELLQHANLETTKRYTGGAVSERVNTAIAKLADAHTRGPRGIVARGKGP